MTYTIFISHSSADISLVQFIASQLQLYGITPVIAQYEPPREFPQYLPEKVKTLIQESDCVTILLTKSGVNSKWVHQEIGYALNKKPLIPIVESDISPLELGFLQGTEYIPLDWKNIENSIKKLVSWSTQLKLKKEENEFLKILAMIIIGGLALWGISQQKNELIR